MRKLRSGLCVCSVVLCALGAAATAQAQQQFNQDVHIETNNTPRITLIQSGGSYAAYSWDVAANEANFFVRDLVTGRLPFQIRPGAPQGSIEVRDTGAVSVPRGAIFGSRATEFVTQNGIGDRTEVSADELLQAIRALPVPEWKYLGGPDEDRHIGPLAADFNAAFGLGNSETVAPGDVAGVALAAAQALDRQNQDLERQNQSLERQNQRFRNRLSKLGKRVAKQGKLLRKLKRKIG